MYLEAYDFSSSLSFSPQNIHSYKEDLEAIQNKSSPSPVVTALKTPDFPTSPKTPYSNDSPGKF